MHAADITIKINGHNEPYEETIDAGGAIALTCLVGSKSQRSVRSKVKSYKWIKGDNKEKPLGYLDRLEIQDFTPEEEGEYRCIVTFKCSCKWWARLKKESSPCTLRIKGECMVSV